MNEDHTQQNAPVIPAAAEVTELVNQRESPVRLKSLRTFQGDVQEAMAKNNTSIVHIALAEQTRKQKEPEPQQTPVSYNIKNKSFLVVGISFLTIGLIVIGVVYYMNSRVNPLSVPTNGSIVNYSQAGIIDATNMSPDQFNQTVLQQKQSVKLPVNNLLFIDVQGSDKKTLPTENFLSLLAPNMPSTLARSFAQKYMFGIYSYDTNTPFVILTTEDYGASYSGMLKWEENMSKDLGILFGLSSDIISKPSIFTDESVKNKDLRILVDANGKTVLVYSFIDKNTLIIASSEDIFTALLGKYTTAQMVR